MNFDAIVALADVIAGVGVIASLIFVGVEVRRNTHQAKLQNWASLIDRFISILSQTGDLDLAAVIAKGRIDYAALTDAEKVAYGDHLLQVVMGLEAFLNFSENVVHGRDEMERQFEEGIKYNIGCPGGLAWYREFQATRPMPPAISQRIDQVLAISR